MYVSDQQATQVIQSPCVVIEVLSPSTEEYDRGEKFRQYRRLESLTEYVLVNAENWGVEVFRLNQQKHWELVQDLTCESQSVAINKASDDNGLRFGYHLIRWNPPLSP